MHNAKETNASFSTSPCGCGSREKLTSRKTKAVLIAEILDSCEAPIRAELSRMRKRRARRNAKGLLHPYRKVPNFGTALALVKESLPGLTKHELLLAQHGIGIAH
jgi:hypothetical protein